MTWDAFLMTHGAMRICPYDISPNSPYENEDGRRARFDIRYIFGNLAMRARLPDIVTISQPGSRFGNE